MNFEYLKQIISEHYDIGTLVRAKRNHHGYTHISFEIGTRHKGKHHRYLMRFYKKGTSEERIRFEHALVNELTRREFRLTPRLIPLKNGATWMKRQKEDQDVYTALFSFLEGETKYNWNNALCAYEELRDAATTLALYHNTISGWIKERTEPGIIAHLPGMAERWQRYATTSRDSWFDAYFSEHADKLIRAFKLIPDQTICNALPCLAIHGDYHPGNLRFHKGKVIGVFDFDHANIDARVFDVAFALWYFCTDLHGQTSDILCKERANRFLAAYQQSAAEVTGSAGPLNRLELKCLSGMMLLANLCMIDWFIGQVRYHHGDPEEYTVYLQKAVGLIDLL